MLQETHHLSSSKVIHETGGKYVVFHHSGVDEDTPFAKTNKGGVITYVSIKFKALSKIHRQTKHYLMVTTGMLVTINVYLPQPNLNENGKRDGVISTYATILGDILAEVNLLGPNYVFIIAGDFNSNGNNRGDFREFFEQASPEDWSATISYTYSRNTSNGLCHTKPDHVLALNFPRDSLRSCRTDPSTHVFRSPHLPIVTEANIPHLEFNEDRPESLGNLSPRVQIDFARVTEAQLEEFQAYANQILSPSATKIHVCSNPIREITRVFNEIGSYALCTLPQRVPTTSRHRKPRPGWNEYVKDIHQEYVAALEEWEVSGFARNSELAERVTELNKAKLKAMHERERNEKKIVAQKMCGDLTASCKENRSLCWKPVGQTLKGNAYDCSPIVEGIIQREDQANFWADYYCQKMSGTWGDYPLEIKVDLGVPDSTDIEIPVGVVVEAIRNLNRSCAYYDDYTPNMLVLITKEFASVYAAAINRFLNMDIKRQIECLKEGDNFLASYIIPIMKGLGLNPTIPKSYRPIAVSHTLYNLFENVVACPSNPFQLETAKPPNFFGYIGGRSCDLAVQLLKKLVRQGQGLGEKVLVTLDASGAFEGVHWDIVFPRLAAKNNPRIIRALWLMYSFNRYEVRWANCVGSSKFCATLGTRQGGILSGPFFCEYMSILADRLAEFSGIEQFSRSFNSIFYADDLLLVCKNVAHAQTLLDVCHNFESDGYIRWNSDKTKVLHLSPTRLPASTELPEKSCLTLKGVKLDRVTTTKWLGYILNYRVNDDDMIRRQICRLHAIGNNIKAYLPLDLLEPPMLRQLAVAYGNIYLLPVLKDSNAVLLRKLHAAHRCFTMNVTNFLERHKDLRREDGVYTISNDRLYKGQNIKTVAEMRCYQENGFWDRFSAYVRGFDKHEGAQIWVDYLASESYAEYKSAELSRIEREIGQFVGTSSQSSQYLQELQEENPLIERMRGQMTHSQVTSI